ncbi:hypothetical protein FHX14_004280 [Rhizobium sp. BK619]|uniref:hypothetical protein n=1 Tax=Rhizobium sp. BK619 TaxID=2586989 RepID=UPI00160F3DFF|nr:hypothetical protein [Rhizobium sp. BK619]MBB3648055.1 hypothetical protein [Rhizobium sp. BK619]
MNLGLKPGVAQQCNGGEIGGFASFHAAASSNKDAALQYRQILKTLDIHKYSNTNMIVRQCAGEAGEASLNIASTVANNIRMKVL